MHSLVQVGRVKPCTLHQHLWLSCAFLAWSPQKALINEIENTLKDVKAGEASLFNFIKVLVVDDDGEEVFALLQVHFFAELR